MNASVRDWLYTVVRPYGSNKDFVLSHLDALLSDFKALSPRTAAYTHDDGRTQLLICVQGTLPVTFKNKIYHIPVAFWLPFDYPSVPPIVYVVPTQTMLVRASRDVDISGKCAGSYWSNWARKAEGCTLVDLAKDYQEMFGRQPPVYAKPANIPTTTIANPANTSPRPAPRRPEPENPQIPQRPSANGFPTPLPLNRPPLPMTPSTGGSPARPNSSMLPRPKSLSHQPAMPPSPYYNSSPPPASPLPPQLPAFPIQNILPPIQPPTQDIPGPRRPTNPEIVNLRTDVLNRLTSALHAKQQQHHAELAQLDALHNDLAQGEPAIRDEMQRLQAVRDVCTSVRDRHALVNQELRAHIQALSERDIGTVDEIVACQSVLHSQLLDLVADDHAIEDTIYQLGQGLLSETVQLDLDSFLKKVRPLARDQFLKRALINKILLDMAVDHSRG